MGLDYEISDAQRPLERVLRRREQESAERLGVVNDPMVEGYTVQSLENGDFSVKVRHRTAKEIGVS